MYSSIIIMTPAGVAFAGLLKDLFGWSAVFASWAIFSLAGVLMVVLAIRKQKRQAQ